MESRKQIKEKYHQMSTTFLLVENKSCKENALITCTPFLSVNMLNLTLTVTLHYLQNICLFILCHCWLFCKAVTKTWWYPWYPHPCLKALTSRVCVFSFNVFAFLIMYLFEAGWLCMVSRLVSCDTFSRKPFQIFHSCQTSAGFKVRSL